MKDVSQTNPGLHALYVGWAQEHLTIIGEAIELLSAMSQYQPSETAALLVEQRQTLVLTDAAYRDAAANLLAGIAAPETTGQDAAAEDAEVADRTPSKKARARSKPRGRGK